MIYAMLTTGDEWRGKKPPSFDGDEEKWTEWPSVMRAFLGSVHEVAVALMEAAEERVSPDISLVKIDEALGPGCVAASKRLYFALAMTVKGSAQAVVRSVEQCNGAMAWRMLCDRYEPDVAARLSSTMSHILAVHVYPSTLSEFEDKCSEWEMNIRGCESLSGEVFNTTVLKGIFIDRVPRGIRTMLQMQSGSAYQELVATVWQYLQSTARHNVHLPRKDVDAMEVDAFTRAGARAGILKVRVARASPQGLLEEDRRVLYVRQSRPHLQGLPVSRYSNRRTRWR